MNTEGRPCHPQRLPKRKDATQNDYPIQFENSLTKIPRHPGRVGDEPNVSSAAWKKNVDMIKLDLSSASRYSDG